MTEPAPGLFDAPTVAHRPGAVERSLTLRVQEGRAAGSIRDVDEPLVEAALVAARALDTADRIGGLKGGYLTAQSLPGYQKVLHALRLPDDLTPAPAPAAGEGQSDVPSWLSDAFGTAE